MTPQHKEILEVLEKFSPISADEVSKFLPRRLRIVPVVFELIDMHAKGWAEQRNGYTPQTMVTTYQGLTPAKPSVSYWSITDAGLEALKAARPPEPVRPQYLGETPVNILDHPKYSKYEPKDWALQWIAMYSGIDGAHHKDWLIAQVAKILCGTQVLMKIARWDNGQEEERFILGEDSTEFTHWKTAYEGDVYPDGATEYEFDEGTPP